ncbi:MAG TPA: thioesterase family protein [Stellaceae bacterium]|nr:thioesterase family protein [Stellaceae bacterium]
MSEAPEGPNLADRAGYKLWFQEHVRYSDVDHNNHVNHAVFLNYFETARVSITRKPELGLLEPGENFNVVRVEVDYKAELRFPGNFEIGMRGLKYGRSSFRLGQAVFQGDKCLCTEEVVLVFMDRATRKSKPLSPKLIDWLKEHGATAS